MGGEWPNFCACMALVIPKGRMLLLRGENITKEIHMPKIGGGAEK
jgi:hypothetical protein